MRLKNWIFLGLFYLICANANAGSLPLITGMALDGDQLTWDAQDGASGYNVYLDRRYFDTVRGATTYTVTEPGAYLVVSFNEAGDFGVFREPDGSGDSLEALEYTGTSSTVSYNFQGATLLVYNTCQSVGPGETCTARCPANYTHYYYEGHPGTTISSHYLSGGACATSDIIEADAFIGPLAYRCTVPTFSGEVLAQAICVVF